MLGWVTLCFAVLSLTTPGDRQLSAHGASAQGSLGIWRALCSLGGLSLPVWGAAALGTVDGFRELGWIWSLRDEFTGPHSSLSDTGTAGGRGELALGGGSQHWGHSLRWRRRAWPGLWGGPEAWELGRSVVGSHGRFWWQPSGQGPSRQVTSGEAAMGSSGRGPQGPTLPSSRPSSRLQGQRLVPSASTASRDVPAGAEGVFPAVAAGLLAVPPHPNPAVCQERGLGREAWGCGWMPREDGGEASKVCDCTAPP